MGKTMQGRVQKLVGDPVLTEDNVHRILQKARQQELAEDHQSHAVCNDLPFYSEAIGEYDYQNAVADIYAASYINEAHPRSLVGGRLKNIARKLQSLLTSLDRDPLLSGLAIREVQALFRTPEDIVAYEQPDMNILTPKAQEILWKLMKDPEFSYIEIWLSGKIITDEDITHCKWRQNFKVKRMEYLMDKGLGYQDLSMPLNLPDAQPANRVANEDAAAQETVVIPTVESTLSAIGRGSGIKREDVVFDESDGEDDPESALKMQAWRIMERLEEEEYGILPPSDSEEEDEYEGGETEDQETGGFEDRYENYGTESVPAKVKEEN